VVPSLRCIPISKTKYPKVLDVLHVPLILLRPTGLPQIQLLLGMLMLQLEVPYGTELLSEVKRLLIERIGDTAKISIGKNCVVHDLAHFMSIKRKKGDHIHIGNSVFVGANAKIDACNLESFSYVGMGATVERGVTCEGFSVVAAGSVVKEGSVIPSGQVWAGSPAQYLRDLSQEEKHSITEYMQEMQQMASIYQECKD
jgi:carbonic anhydrase/acetyltransferase-like protein (isoleucine patch superfamily)